MIKGALLGWLACMVIAEASVFVIPIHSAVAGLLTGVVAGFVGVTVGAVLGETRWG